MKTKLLKLALCAVALLPMGAWADGITQTTLWTFDQYYPGTLLPGGSGTDSDRHMEYAGLYINGMSHASSPHAVSVANGSSYAQSTIAEKTVNMVSCLSFVGPQNSDLKNNRSASSYTADCVAFQAGVAGTVYVDIAGNSGSDRTFNIYVASGSGSESATKNTTTMTSGRSVISASVTEGASVFISVSAGSWSLYAVKFVPTSEASTNKVITMSDMGVMTFSDTHAWTLPAGLKAYTLRALTNGKPATYEIASGSTIPAMTAVILQGEHGQNYTLTSADVTGAGTQDGSTALAMNNMLRPVIKDYNLPASNTIGTGTNNTWYNFILVKDGDNMVFKQSSGSGNITAGKAFYAVRSDLVNFPSGDAHIFLDLGSNETTSIEKVKNNMSEEAHIFDLQGRRILQPSKGLYIVNGKKVIIK